MKKLSLILILFMTFFTAQMSFAMTFEEVYKASENKPALIVIYADWAEGYKDTLSVFKQIQQKVGKKYNYAELNIATKDAKAFNDRYDIYTNLPYMMLIKSGGKITRYLPKTCANDKACVLTKMENFVF